MKKILVFLDEKFPGYVKNSGIENWNEAKLCKAQELRRELKKEYDVFVNAHGSYFPEEALEEVFCFLGKGKGFVNLFDTPFVYPCRRNEENAEWLTGRARMSYFRRLNIHSVLDADQSRVTHFVWNERNEIAKPLAAVLKREGVTRNFVMIPTKDKYIEKEWGSSGSMDAKMIPLVKGSNDAGEPISSPVVLIENRAGNFGGGRWIFVNSRIEEGAKAEDWLAPLTDFVETGYRELMVKPSMASYYPGERPALRISAENFGKPCTWSVEIRCSKDGETLSVSHCTLENGLSAVQKTVLPDVKVTPGHYSVHAVFVSDDGERQEILQGFCVRDDELLQSMTPVICGKDYMEIDGVMQPIVGTTYMSGESSRSFLHIPNTANWLSDMQEMKAEGVNWIRTGMWCNWRTYMMDDGHFEETVLRSVDAFLQVAAMVGLHVTITFFTFVPEPFEGSHPYLDRRSINAQKRFISNIITRHKNTTNVDWDLINEPFTTDHPSQTKKDDVLETADFQAYMKDKYKTASNMAEALDLCLSPGEGFETLAIPKREQINFDITDMGDSKNGLIWKDYVEYTVDMFKRWVAEMNRMLKDANNRWLVTVGQDEALRGQRPTPLLYGELLDYNSQHTWWLLDDLVWDTRFTKYYGKPLLVQETGVMYAEMPNGVPRRTEEDIARLLQKKYAYAYGTRCAGAVQWIWNTNYYLKSANESNIGAIRCDGSRKPEFYVYRDFARFFGQAAGRVSDIVNKQKIAVVFPFSNDFSNRNFAQEATTQITKVLTYYLKQDFMGVSEFDLAPLWKEKPQAVFVPSAHQFRNGAFAELTQFAEQTGAVLIFTGPISLDENFGKTNRAAEWFGKTELAALGRFETVNVEGESVELSFDNRLSVRAYKEGPDGAVRSKKLGAGEIVWCGIPLELSCESEKLAQIYRTILEKYHVTPDVSLEETATDAIFVSRVEWEKGTLFTVVNESTKERTLTLKDEVSGRRYRFDVEGDGSFLFITDIEGKPVSVYQDRFLDCLS